MYARTLGGVDPGSATYKPNTGQGRTQDVRDALIWLSKQAKEGWFFTGDVTTTTTVPLSLWNDAWFVYRPDPVQRHGFDIWKVPENKRPLGALWHSDVLGPAANDVQQLFNNLRDAKEVVKQLVLSDAEDPNTLHGFVNVIGVSGFEGRDLVHVYVDRQSLSTRPDPNDVSEVDFPRFRRHFAHEDERLFFEKDVVTNNLLWSKDKTYRLSPTQTFSGDGFGGKSRTPLFGLVKRFPHKYEDVDGPHSFLRAVPQLVLEFIGKSGGSAGPPPYPAKHKVLVPNLTHKLSSHLGQATEADGAQAPLLSEKYAGYGSFVENLRGRFPLDEASSKPFDAGWKAFSERSNEWLKWRLAGKSGKSDEPYFAFDLSLRSGQMVSAEAYAVALLIKHREYQLPARNRKKDLFAIAKFVRILRIFDFVVSTYGGNVWFLCTTSSRTSGAADNDCLF